MLTVSVTLWPGCKVPPDEPSVTWPDCVLADQACALPSAVIVSWLCDEVPRLSEPGETSSVAGPWAAVLDGVGSGSGRLGSRGGETGGLVRSGPGSGWVTLAKSSSLALGLAAALVCDQDRVTVVGEPAGTAPSAPAPARRGITGPPPVDAAGPWPGVRTWLSLAPSTNAAVTTAATVAAPKAASA